MNLWQISGFIIPVTVGAGTASCRRTAKAKESSSFCRSLPS
jgi:hypothetical protein